MSGIEVKKTCCRFCFWLCPVQVHIKDGKVVKVEGDSIDSTGRHFLCEKAALGALDFHSHPQRLNYPLKRAGARGEGKWERVSWQQAMVEIAEKLNGIRAGYGPEAVAVATDHGSFPLLWPIHRWCNLFGTPNTLRSTKNCLQPQVAVEVAVYGSDTFPNFPQPGVTKCMVVFGGNPYISAPQAWRLFVQTKKQGAKLIVIDPRRTHTAEMADLWLQIKPGTDGALAYAMLNVIIEEGLYDKQFVERWCLGFEQVRDFVKQYPPQAVENITWVPQEKIVEAARMYAMNKPAIMEAMWGVTHSQLGKGRTLCVNLAKCVMRAITGNLDVEGGERLREKLWVDYARNMHWDKLINHPLRKRDTIGAERFPIMSVGAFKTYSDIWQKVYGDRGYPMDRSMTPNVSPWFAWNGIIEGKPYPIKALLVSGTNILCTRTNTRLIYRALTSKNLELHVTLDVFMTPDGMLADYVLPAADWMERLHMNPTSAFGDLPYGNLGEQAVPPEYERRNEYDLCRDLGRLLGQQEYWPDTLEEMCDKFLEPTGLTFKEMVHRVRWEKGRGLKRRVKSEKKYEESGFATRSGKVELVPTLLEELGCEILPHYRELVGISEEDYPLILIAGGRTRPFFHSTLRELPKLRQRHPDPMVQMHPDTAREYQIASGEWVGIETPLGMIKHKAELTDGIHPGVVHIEHGWWFPEKKGEEPNLFGVWESNAGAILPDEPEVCDFQGGPPMRVYRCRLVKLDQVTPVP